MAAHNKEPEYTLEEFEKILETVPEFVRGDVRKLYTSGVKTKSYIDFTVGAAKLLASRVKPKSQSTSQTTTVAKTPVPDIVRVLTPKKKQAMLESYGFRKGERVVIDNISGDPTKNHNIVEIEDIADLKDTITGENRVLIKFFDDSMATVKRGNLFKLKQLTPQQKEAIIAKGEANPLQDPKYDKALAGVSPSITEQLERHSEALKKLHGANPFKQGGKYNNKWFNNCY